MKKLLFATVFASTALASSMGCNTDTLTGLHFGLGVSVLFDKYEADVDVGTNVPYMKKISATTIGTVGTDVTVDNVKELLKNIWNGTPALVYDEKTKGPDVLKQGSTTDYLLNTFVTKNSTSGAIYSADRALWIQHHTFKKRTTNCGGEVKLAYFHDFGNHLMVGVDLTGVIASKNKKTIHIAPGIIQYPNELTVSGTGADDTTASSNGEWSGTTTGSLGGSETTKVLSIGCDFTELHAEYKKIGGGILLNGTDYDSGTKGDADASFNEMALITCQYNDPDDVTKVIKDNAELTFEKSVFNPRLAFIVGGTVYGWFAGLRLGMSYTTGKVYATGGKLTGQGTQSKTVSISSPLIGLHLMKQMKIAGNNDAHLYLTADWNIGDGRRSVLMNGVKNFKQSGYQISAGLTWRFKLGN